MTKPPLDLYAEVETASGARFPWDANQAAGSRPRGGLIRTRLGEGFSDGGLQLARRIDLDYPDLALGNNVVLTGSDGSVAYEGRISEMPRELADDHSIGVTLTGWMAHASDRRFSDIFVDRDMTAWGAGSRARKTALVLGNFTPLDAEQGSDPTDNQQAVISVLTDSWVSPYVPISEAWYDAGPNNLIGSINYSWAREGTTINPASAWTWGIGTSSDDKTSAYETSGNLVAAGPTSLATFTPATARRFAFLQLYFTTPGGTDGARFAIDWKNLAVYGNSGIPKVTGEAGQPPGVTPSDVMRYLVTKYCPMLDPSGIQDSSYPIQHLAFKEPTRPYDAFLELNKYVLWNLGVFEDRKVVFAPYNLDDYTWEIRTDEPGTTFSPQGPSIDGLFNGIQVTYQDVGTGIQNVLSPDVYPELRDTTVGNPWKDWGIPRYDDVTLSWPTTLPQALSLGRARLADTNTPKHPGTITVRGHVRDRAGNWQQGWKVRAGDTVTVSSFPNDQPRLIHEATWDDESKTLTLAVDAPPSTLDAYQDRVINALTARGLA